MSGSPSTIMFNGVYQFALVGAVGVTAILAILLCLRRRTLERRRLQNMPPQSVPLGDLVPKPRLYDAYLDGHAELWHDMMPVSLHPVGSWTLNPSKHLDATPLVSTLSTVAMIVAMPSPLSHIRSSPDRLGHQEPEDEPLPYLEFGVTDLPLRFFRDVYIYVVWAGALCAVCHCEFIEPTVVNEAEFRLAPRLVDQLYDVAPNAGGPNGTSLSIIYQQLLNNLLPKYIDNTDIMARQQLREKTLAQTSATSTGTASSTTNPGDANTAPANGMMFSLANKPSGESLNRIELSELLMNEYLYAKQDWEIERDNLIMQAEVGSPEAQRALNDLTRRLAHITDMRQAQLAAKYAGLSRDVKDSLREAAMSSLDGSMSIYPVQLTLLDWFTGLSTSFALEDLTQNLEVIRGQIRAKSQDLDTLSAQLVALQMSAKGDPTALKSQVLGAQNALDDAQSALAQNFSNNMIEMAKTCLDADGVVAQTDLTKSSRALSQMLVAQALAEATDTKQQQHGVNPPTGVDHSQDYVPTSPIVLPPESSSGGKKFLSPIPTKSREARVRRHRCSEHLNLQHRVCFGLWRLFNCDSYGTSISDDTIDLALRINPTVTWTNATPETMPRILRGEIPATGLMPGFPIGFLIADIVVASHRILGYMIHITDPELMPPTLPKNFFIPDADSEYNKVVEGGDGPAHTIDPVTPPRAITEDKLREVLDKMLNEKIGAIFEEVTHAAGGSPQRRALYHALYPSSDAIFALSSTTGELDTDVHAPFVFPPSRAHLLHRTTTSSLEETTTETTLLLRLPHPDFKRDDEKRRSTPLHTRCPSRGALRAPIQTAKEEWLNTSPRCREDLLPRCTARLQIPAQTSSPFLAALPIAYCRLLSFAITLSSPTPDAAHHGTPRLHSRRPPSLAWCTIGEVALAIGEQRACTPLDVSAADSDTAGASWT
ncbi:hypothetical protein C8R45DRAFT_1112322 [Mycena sanguinolenta]|nr:hypothetical protein C8R45DRAFT_1112322 [Mycena sanguinolenta]